MRYQTPRLHIGLVRFHQKMDTRMFQFLDAVLELMEDNFQARGLTTLEGPELCRTNHMVSLFLNITMRDPSKIYASYLFVHVQKRDYHRCLRRSRLDFSHRDLIFNTSSSCLSSKIIHRAHFPPTLVSSQLLESSLEPNWLPPMDTMVDEWDLMKEWAFGTVKRTRLLILPSFQQLFNKNTSSSPHLLKRSLIL